MSNEVEDDPYAVQYSLTDLLAHHNAVNENVKAEQYEDEKATAIETYGLTDSVSKKTSRTKGGATTESVAPQPTPEPAVPEVPPTPAAPVNPFAVS